MFPALAPEEMAHAERVADRVRARIVAAGGWIPFDRFMELALYEPGLGYYSAGAAKFGPAGDFTTAPEISDLFSRCVAVQCREVGARLAARGERWELLEIGAGSGRMAAAVLEELAALGSLPERYCILETSADLRARQQQRINALPAGLADRAQWLDRWPAHPLRGVVLANEVLDALPCERFAWHASGPLALGVALDEAGRLVESARPADARLASAVRAIVARLPQRLPEGYRSELRLRLEPWLGPLAAAIGSGVALLFDYGLPRAQLYHPERGDGTLLCHFRHRAHHDYLRFPGLQDITAWVDFSAVAAAAAAHGLEVAGFATQAAFLLGNGIEARIAMVASENERSRLAAEARRLLLPGEMGEAFKVMALARPPAGGLAGFELQDLRGSL
jgi:SAM-dependent MidA family methyltransferase